MAEVKNAFIKSKMNKDLDSRLLPSGEYRDGQNIQVSKSEGEDVGALENAVGNVITKTSSGPNSLDDVDFSVLNGLPSGTLKSIGVYADVNTSNIFVFLTDYGPSTELEDFKYSNTAKNYIYSYNTLTSSVVKLVEGSFLNFSKNSPIYGINILENLLFWTDNRNQPRKINLSKANPNELANPTYYTTEDNISVAKYNPYQAIELYYIDTQTQTPIGDVNPNINQTVCSSQDVTSEFLPDGVTKNMYYNPNWPGDEEYLSDKFVSFSYRFKFIDGEYSILAPFSQEAFIPKQDGYFLGSGDNGDETEAYRSSIVKFMENKVNNVKLRIPMPLDASGSGIPANELMSKLNVSYIDIIYKESDSLNVKVVESIPFSDFSTQADGETPNTQASYIYDYQSRKPYKTLPESEIIRVYDKVPVKAFGQEVIGNRVVYANFQDKHTPPLTIDYDVAVTSKEPFSTSGNKATWNTSQVEYPEHTLKQNRSYQVGFVLSDKYGRQSTTILSPVKSTLKLDPASGTYFGGSTYYHPYQADPGPGNNIINSWPGDSLKVLINSKIPDKNEITGEAREGYPGLYNGDVGSPDYNPLGWYSYKIVVKQTEQEYYNVYLPGILDGYPDFGSQQTPPDPEGTIAHITLISDNINKVPRDLTEVGPEQRQYRSDVRLYGRVSPERTSSPTFTIPYYPQTNYQEVVAVAEQDYIFTDAAVDAPYGTIYQSDSDPYIARLTQNNVSTAVGSTLPLPIGSLQSTGNPGASYNILLGVFETNPVESLLDIFWETTTTGLISDLNSIAGDSTVVSDFDFQWQQTEASVAGSYITSNPFFPKVQSGISDEPIVNSLITLLRVTDSNGDITNDWSGITRIQANQPAPDDTIEAYDRYNIEVVTPKFFELNQGLNTFNFEFLVTNNDVTPSETYNRTITVVLGNVAPSINDPGVIAAPEDPNVPVKTFTGVNGAGNSLNTTALLKWSKVSQSPSTPELLLSESGVLTEPSGTAKGSFDLVIKLEDTSGALTGKETTLPVIVNFGESQINPGFGNISSQALAIGLESAGLFWSSDYSESSLIDTVDVSSFSSDGTGGRNAYENLILDNTGLQNANEQKLLYLSNNIQDSEGEPWKWKNSNFKPKHFDIANTYSDHSLTKGTAYIKVDFNFKGWPSLSTSTNGSGEETGGFGINSQEEKIGVGWVAYLQYRASSTGNWTTAVDVEGVDIHFGGLQTNVLGQADSTNNNFKDQGFINNNSTSNIISTSGIPLDTAVSLNPYVGDNQTQTAPTSVFSRIFAFGEDQGYESTPSKFGEYRLLIKYPERIANPPIIIPSPETTTLQPLAKNNSRQVETNVGVDIAFGDFYYAKEANQVAYAYRISTVGSTDAASALNNNPTQLVYAREWAYKYVTQFYTDEELKNKYQATTINQFYSYSGATADTQNAKLGNENSYIYGNNSNIEAANVLNSKNTSNRRWAAQFDGDGKKIIGTAVPSSVNLN